MLPLEQNACYLSVLRPPVKSVKHCTSGTCEIERVSFQNDHTYLQYSIKHSKMLQRYKKQYPYSHPFNVDQLLELYEAKNIFEDKARFYVGKITKQLHCTLYAFAYIQSLKKQAYCSTNQKHEQYLLGIWNNLKPKQKLQDRISNQWISVGFQANDPATDFRGSGFLGLLNLYNFSSKQKSQNIFAIACDPNSEYFFCSAGLFFTMLASQMLKERKPGYDFWVHDNQEDLIKKFQNLYNMLFLQFSDFWLNKCGNKSIMYFNQNLKLFENEALNWNERMIKGKIQQCLS